MPKEEQRYWFNQKKSKDKAVKGGEMGDEALRTEIKDLKAEIAQMKMGGGVGKAQN